MDSTAPARDGLSQSVLDTLGALEVKLQELRELGVDYDPDAVSRTLREAIDSGRTDWSAQALGELLNPCLIAYAPPAASAAPVGVAATAPVGATPQPDDTPGALATTGPPVEMAPPSTQATRRSAARTTADWDEPRS